MKTNLDLKRKSFVSVTHSSLKVAQRRQKAGATAGELTAKQATAVAKAPTSMWAKAIIPGAVWTKETFPEFPDVSVTTDSALAAVFSFCA
jgi:hypothetical protein